MGKAVGLLTCFLRTLHYQGIGPGQNSASAVTAATAGQSYNFAARHSFDVHILCKAPKASLTALTTCAQDAPIRSLRFDHAACRQRYWQQDFQGMAVNLVRLVLHHSA